MKYAHYYWLFEPVPNDLIDNPNRLPVFKLPVKYLNTEYEFALLCGESGLPELARVRIPNLTEDKIPENVLPLLQGLKEHLLSTLRLTFRQDIYLFPIAVWSFFDKDNYELNLRIEPPDDVVLGAEITKNLFSASLGHREELRLLVDGNDSRLPIQYRILSFYKLIEHEFKSNGQWKIEELDTFLSTYSSQFNELGFTIQPAKVLHIIRDKCAHIKTGAKKEARGLTHLNHKETALADRLLPLLRVICTDIVNRKAENLFRLGDITPWFERELTKQS